MIISFFLYAADGGGPLDAAGPTVDYLKRRNQGGSVTDLNDPPVEITNPDGNRYEFEIDDALFLPGSTISYRIDCTELAASRYEDGHLSSADATQSVQVASSEIDFTIKRGDLLPAFRCSLVDDETGAVRIPESDDVVVTFRMRLRGGEVLKVDAEATVVNARRGVVQYDWVDGDTATSGIYDAEFVVSDGPRTLPRSTFYSIEILPSLAD